MSNQTADERVIKSYVWHGSDCYFVSTINRESSAMLGPSRFAETIVWNFDWLKNERKELIHIDGAGRSSLRAHFNTCQKLFDGGAGALRNED